MRENVSESKNIPNPQKTLIIGCLLGICIFLFFCLIAFAIVYRSEIPEIKKYFPTSTLIPTTIPHVLVYPPPNDVLVFKDDFTTNDNNWSTYYFESKVEVKNGRLIIESFSKGLGVAYCFCQPSTQGSVNDTYYLQADLSTEKFTEELYGLVFGLSEGGDFYEFSINPIKKHYSLDKSLDTGWVKLASGSDQIIKAYPEVNTLSVYFDHGTIELFINGEKVATYVDKSPINKGKIGFIVDDANFKLVIDNLFFYTK